MDLERSPNELSSAPRALNVTMHRLSASAGHIKRVFGRVKPPAYVHFCLPCYRGIVGSGHFAEAFWLCSQSWWALDTMAGVEAAAHLMHIVTGCYEQVAAELDAAMQAVCEKFNGDVYSKVRQVKDTTYYSVAGAV